MSQIRVKSKYFFIPVLLMITLMVDSCKKDTGIATPAPAISEDAKSKSAKINESVEKALRDFVVSVNVSVNQQIGIGSGSNVFVNTAVTVTSYTTPTANVFSWTNVSTGTTFTLTQSASLASGAGLGQLSYNGKSFDYNYVLCINASANDPSWSSFFNGRDLRGVVAIDGDILQNDFSFKNLAIFLVDASSGDGSYDFVSWNSSTVRSGEAIGELLDFSIVANPNLISISAAGVLFTSNGSVDVTQTSFTMGANAKVTDILTLAEYDISGVISCE